MSESAPQEALDIFATRILAKAELIQQQEIFQECYSVYTPTGTKAPLRLYIINHDAVESTVPNTSVGSPVRCVKLCKRVLDGPPRNSIICTQKSKVILDFELVLIVEYEDNTFDVMTLPKNLSSALHYDPTITKAFTDPTVIDLAGTPVTQRQALCPPLESLSIQSTGVNEYHNFQYTVSIPLSCFSCALKKCELNDPTLQSYILLRNLNYDVEVLDTFQVFTAADNSTSIWTTIVELSVFEDIIDKLGIDQDIVICGIPEYACEDCDC